jgi:hypothetical protein
MPIACFHRSTDNAGLALVEETFQYLRLIPQQLQLNHLQV